MTEVSAEQGSLQVEIPGPPVTTRELILGLGTMAAGAVVLGFGGLFKDPIMEASGFTAVNVGFVGLGYFGWRGAAPAQPVEASIPEQPEAPEP